ncbi:cutinase family protein [Mycolicibacterium fallax]|uniref:Uncharacterized protein n=1 Tax=Mycolicibacterium fallax TaxID=1793 RepID=A0A1X1RGH1_MYCFA|nr:cutinase family protein [Mycolicibacterium fallax]ORV05106.1 hypothetical protein AWC04_07465 [Mycolicibacterium fallax]BBY97485.1 cutinase [Mycolicibacterium fallax]
MPDGALARAVADPCPDIGVAFARGTAESPGVGNIGQAFVDAMRAQAAPRTVGVHGVNYPASNDFNGAGFQANILDGVRDLRDHVRGVVSVCPQTQMVIGGYSQGAMVAEFATADALPEEVPGVPQPLPTDVADKVVAVVLLGKPNGASSVKYGAPVAGPGPGFAGKTLQLCAPEDPVCALDPAAPWNPAAHSAYVPNGMVGEGAAFAVGRLTAPPPPLRSAAP